MKVRLLTGLSGSEGSWLQGEVIERPDAEALRLIERGYAEPVASSGVQTAALAVSETAALPHPRPRRRK